MSFNKQGDKNEIRYLFRKQTDFVENRAEEHTQGWDRKRREGGE